MSFKKCFLGANRIARWLGKRELASRKGMEDKKDIEYKKRQDILERIKQGGIAVRAVFKGKLGDDLRIFEYKVMKVERNMGIVTLKNERGTFRKVSVYDKIFGPVKAIKKSKLFNKSSTFTTGY